MPSASAPDGTVRIVPSKTSPFHPCHHPIQLQWDLTVEFEPSRGRTFEDSDLYCQVTIHTDDGKPFSGQVNTYLETEGFMSPPSDKRMEEPTKDDHINGFNDPKTVHIFKFSPEEKPIFLKEAIGHKLGLKVEIGSFEDDEILGYAVLPGVKITDPNAK